MGLQGFNGMLNILKAENQYRSILSAKGKGIRVFYVQAGLDNFVENILEPPWMIGDFDRNDIGDVDHVVLFLQNLLGLLPVIDNEAKDPELLGIGQGQGQNINASLGQQSAGFPNLAGLIFKE